MRKAWEGLGRAPEPWMRAERDRGGSQGQNRGWSGAGAVDRTAAAMLEVLLQEQGTPGQGRGADRDDLHNGDR